MLLAEMTDPQEIPTTDGTMEAAEPMLGTFDYILVIALIIAGTYYWFFMSNKKEERPAARTYAIQ